MLLEATGSNEGKGAVNPFARMSKVNRTPPLSTAGESPMGPNKRRTVVTPTVETPKGTNNKMSTGVTHPASKVTSPADDTTTTMQQTASKRDFLINMRNNEEEGLRKCKDIIAKMKAATNRQRNISNDVKIGLMELADTIDGITYYRSSWKKAEAELQKTSEPQQQKPVGEATPETPVLSENKKRPASSPVEKQGKRLREENTPEEWKKQGSRREKRQKQKDKKEELRRQAVAVTAHPVAAPPTLTQKKPKRRGRTRPEALLIKPAGGRSYAEVLGEIRSKAKPEDSETEVKAIRQTRSGGVLLELGAQSKNLANFREALKVILGDKAEVVCLNPKMSLEIRDLDCYTEKAEVERALQRDIPEAKDVKVWLTAPNSRGQKVAVVEMSGNLAPKLLSQGKIKIGWVYCRVRKRAVAERCFKCFGYGHVARTCQGPDRSNLCFKCGNAGHKAKTCTAQSRCVLCLEEGLPQADLAHVLGSGKCKVFRKALEAVKKKL